LSRPLNKELVRIKIVAGAMLAGLLLLGGVLWREQVVKGQEYKHSLDRQSMRRVRLPAVRGLILDRNGICLARNRPSYCIAMYVEELRKPGKREKTVEEVDRLIVELSELLGIPREVDKDDIRKHLRISMPMPFLAWRGISEEVLSRWSERTIRQRGIDVYVEPVREYPQGHTLGHVLGYVRRADPPEDLEFPYHYYLAEMEGGEGIEKSMNEKLCGESGGRLIRVDASGFRHEEMAEREPREGRNLVLTIDSEIQKIAEEVLGDVRGAAVILDPRNGDVIAMASAPSFDPNVFVPRILHDAWNRLNTDSRLPLFNRCISGTYPPGSTFKPLVALAALDSGTVTSAEKLACPGYFDLGKARFHCWNRRGHGKLAMRKAIEQSCNAYFCQLGLECGYEHIFRAAYRVGYGKRTGIELRGEARGLLPGDAWKRRARGDAWRSGDTCNVSIGQGALAVTPLQMAVLTATVANGGQLYRPRLVMGESSRGELIQNVGWSSKSLSLVRGGMYDVMQAETGTGKRGKIDAVEMGGKTGSAEYGPKLSNGKRKKHVWMIVFAPFATPRYAVAMVVEDGTSGGITVAPRIRELMTGIFELESTRKSGRGTGRGA
jgi:penicillin-binding protein 2